MTALQRTGRWIGDHVVLFMAAVVLLYMFLPIFFVVLMSFNDPVSRLAYEFDAFTLDNWLNPCSAAGMCDSVVKSLQIGFLATLGAKVIGTLVAFALVRHSFSGRSSQTSWTNTSAAVRPFPARTATAT